ncbi:MAG TPA: class I SAM-dependent methyltransferase [Syntrophorhabdaceae bacterium]|nr:class I SAM-dependent methyltransferase [Syntrophorhabdaceae bacterium]
MSLKQKIGRLLDLREIEYRWYNRRQARYEGTMSFSQCAAAFPDPNELYAYMHHHFRYLCPQFIRDHRLYFQQEERGFGEDAFHASWWLLLSEFKPARMLEIGIYRGQVITLWALINKYLERSAGIHGISPFGPVGDSVSAYLKDLDYIEDVLASFRFWKLDPPVLVKALSTDAQAIAHIKKNAWDLIYIDGSHDYDVVLSDYRLCRDCLKAGGILVLDDAALGTSFRPPRFSFAGHPGPSRVAREHADKEMRLLGMVGHNNIFQKIHQ